MIPADIGSVLAGAIGAAVTTGDLPAAASQLNVSGTWRRPARGVSFRCPGSYATSLPFELAKLTGHRPETEAARLASPLAALPWISAVTTASGYLTVTVTRSPLASLPARIVAAGPAVARSNALAGVRLTVPGARDPATGSDWALAWQAEHRVLAGRLVEAAGGEVSDTPARTDAALTCPADDTGHETGQDDVVAAVAYYGSDAVRFALAATPGVATIPVKRQLARPLDLSNPFVLVRHAYADAASTLRWAADLGLTTEPPPALASAPLQQAELDLVDAMSWLPERVAAAARRRRPADLVAYLVVLAEAWLDCAENCPALPFRGRGAPADPASPLGAARLELAGAASVTLSAVLALLALTAAPRI